MRVLFVSGEMIAGDLAYRLKLEGCEVKLFIGDPTRKDCFENMVEKTDDWKKELNWVGKDGLIVFDDVIFNGAQDELRLSGYTVFGGNAKGDELERNREFAQKLFASCGMAVEDSKDFICHDDAINYIKNNPSRWVIKQNVHDASLSYIGVMGDGSDALSVLESYKKYAKDVALRKLSLQKRVDGVEVAIARFFNGHDWNSPIFVSFEHKPFLDKNLGPLTGEMGTLAWYDENENNKLFQATLEKIKSYLRSIDYRGYVDINSIVNKDRLIPLEATMRFGSPTNQLQSGMHLSPWKDLLYSTAAREQRKMEYKKGFSIVVCITIPPFPYKMSAFSSYSKGVDILFKTKLTEKEWNQVYFEEVSLHKDSKERQYYIAGSNGYILYITGSGDTVQSARKDAYSLINKVVVPRMMYRTDIGIKYIERDEELLKKWGWI